MLSLATHDFLAWMQVEGAAPLTISAYKSDLGQFQTVLARLGVTELGQIDASHVRRFLIDLKSRQYANATLARKVNCLRSFFTYCEDEGYIQSSPMRRINAPKKEKRVPNYLTGADERRILLAARHRSLQDFVLIKTLILTGMRRTEILSLTWRDIDFEAKALKVRGKGNKEREIPLHEELARDLWRLLHTRLPLRSQAVFVSRQGGPLQRDSLKRIVDQTTAAAGISVRATPHTFRHSFATRLVRQQVDLPTVRDLLGHADISTTSIYVHSSSATKRAAIETLGGIILASEKEGSRKLAGNKCMKVRRLGQR